MDRFKEPDPDLASQLRQSAGREMADEAAEDERLTELHRRRQMDLGAQAEILANRGDRVSIEFGGHTFGGTVVAAGTDYATISGPGQTADVRLDAARWSVLPAGAGTESASSATSESFRALLSGYADSGANVRLALPGGDMVIGRIEVVATDHVDMLDVDGRRLLVPLGLVLAVVRSSDPH